MTKVYLLMEHKSDGSCEIVDIYQDKQYALFWARTIRERDGLFYFVTERPLIGVPD
jgi:hypothetical protein